VVDGQAYEVTEGDYPPVEAPAAPDVPELAGPNPDGPLAASVGDGGGTNWALIAALAAVGAVALVGAGGLLARSRVRHNKGRLHS
jgi:hypothetical protein